MQLEIVLWNHCDICNLPSAGRQVLKEIWTLVELPGGGIQVRVKKEPWTIQRNLESILTNPKLSQENLEIPNALLEIRNQVHGMGYRYLVEGIQKLVNKNEVRIIQSRILITLDWFQYDRTRT